mmetsp:Transcript_9825/g.14776  ORF Transcript_9825/g.14776 Transcript_9825/m.14776 type:complete len:88 (-) Transcript_9825:2-265(-)
MKSGLRVLIHPQCKNLYSSMHLSKKNRNILYKSKLKLLHCTRTFVFFHQIDPVIFNSDDTSLLHSPILVLLWVHFQRYISCYTLSLT